MDATYKLRYLTWTLAPAEGRISVRPTCIKHPDAKISIVDFGGGVVIVCGAEHHLLAHCSHPEFDAEKEQASRQLKPA